MRALFGLTVPLLLLLAAFSTAMPQAAAQETTYTISGRVTSDAGVPLEGARVNAHTYPESDRRTFEDKPGRYAEAVTDANGAYSFKLAAGQGWINVYYEEWRASDGREIDVSADATVDFTFATPPPKDAIIEGRVVDANGNPVRGAEVSLQGRCCHIIPMPAEDVPYREGNTSTGGGSSGNGSGASGATAIASPRIAPPPYYHDDYATTYTDDDGRFRFAAYGGPRQVTAWAKGYAQTTVEVDAVPNETTRVELTLEKVPESDAVIAGRVIDARTGAPLAGAQVSVRSLEWGRYGWAETGPDGSFRVTTVPGWTEISVNYYPRHEEPMPLADADAASKPMILPVRGPQYYPDMQLVKLRSGENTLNAALEPKPQPNIALVGYVVDPETKKAVSGARVNVWNHENGDWGEAVTDATGSYKILVRPGHYSGSAWKEGYLGGTQSFRVGEDASQRVDILLPSGTPKYAPCYGADDGCGSYPMPAYAEPMGAPAVSEDAKAGGLAAASAPSPTAAAPPATTAADLDRTRGQSFEGSGGGLPPYDPEDGAAPRTGEDGTQGDVVQVPGLGALGAALALVGAAVLAMRRRT
ncbi:MAG TPA: carboxypeptidase-like regulatory domain-containing protein [Candidatus Thermoplasmatota archaeon]|nr:carboxypeptidase-like regulatory domain-containing protein [Candidatus Thermoplasmatota archaeon]